MYGMYVSKKLICKDNKKRRLVDTKFLGDWSVVDSTGKVIKKRQRRFE